MLSGWGAGMADWEAVLLELRAIRARLDQVAAVVVSERAAEELLPVYSCGHRHRGHAEAARCLHRGLGTEVAGDA